MTILEDGSSGTYPTPDEVRRQLTAVVASQSFSESPRLSTFLRYIVERTLGGTADGIKEYSIGVDVFGRSSAFDPRTDTIVRVHAGRLRKKLAGYYVGDGEDDPIVIEVPRGGYVPKFRWRPAMDSDPNLTVCFPTEVVDSRKRVEATSRARLQGERAQATVVISRFGGYSGLIEECSAANVDALTNQILDVITRIVEQHGGKVNQFSGEDFLILFGVGSAHEDSVVKAAYATLAIHQAVREANFRTDVGAIRTLCLTSGIDTGTIILLRAQNSAEAYQVVGGPMNTAGMLAFHAGPDQILLSRETNSLLFPFFETEHRRPLQREGSSTLITPFRLVAEVGSQSRLETSALPAYVGREDELDRLHDCLRRVLAGTGQFVSVVGEAGIGKTRLLYEFERQIDKEHLTFISARCQPSDIHTPLLPFVQALNDLLGQSDGTARLGTEEEVLSRLEDIDVDLELYLPLYLHLLSIRSNTHSIPKHLKDNGLRLAILEALSAIFTASSRSRPLVLLLEDWHWSDQGSRDALDQLIALIPAYRVMTVATSRPEYAFSVSSNHTPLRLRPLDSDESFELAKLLLIGAPFSDVQRKSFHNRTGGNPFFLEELCRATREGVDAAVGNGAPRADDQADVPLPFTVRSAIQARLQTLTDNDLRILRVAAVIGYEFGHRVLRQVAENDEVRLQASMERLRVAGHIHKVGVLPEATYRFAHVLVQEAIHDSLLNHQRRTLHKRVGEAIESLTAGHVEEHAERLSLHFRLAEDWPNAIRYARIAIDKSWAISQFAEVLAMLEITEHAARLLPHTEANQEVLIDALLRQERVCETLGRKERQEALIAELISLLEPKGVSARLADVYTRRGDFHNLLGQFEAGEADLDKALRMSREVSDATLESRVLRSMGFLFYRGNQLHKALTCAEEVVMRDRRHGSPRMLLHDLISLSSILNSLGENQSALKFAREAASLAETHDFGDELANTSYVIAEIYRRMGETDQALDYLHEALEHSPYRHGTPLGSLRKPAVIFAAMANIYLEQGDTEESLRHCQDAVDWGRKSMAAEELVMSLRQLGMLLMMLDRPGEAAPHLQEACNLYARMGDLEGEVVMQRALALVFERQGNYAEAMRRAAGVLALQRRRQDALGELEALEALGRLNRSKSGPATVSLRLYRQALTLAKGLDSRERQSNLHNTLGILEWQQGSYEAALSHYQDALRICEEAGDDVHAGLMLNSIGVTLHRLGRLSEAQAVLERALELHRSSERQLLEGHALAAIGDVLYDQEKFELATRLYEMSLEIRRNLNDRTGEAWMLHHLARAHHASGERDAARQRLDEASAIAREDNAAELSEACLLVSNSWVREEI